MARKVLYTRKSQKRAPMKLDFPNPKGEMGYTYKELETSMSKTECKEFIKWMYGQTCGVDKKGNFVYYTQDVHRFLRIVRFKVATYWD